MKRKAVILFLILLSILFVSCQEKTVEFKETKELAEQEWEEVNAIMGTFASDEKNIYMLWGALIYRIDLETREMAVNCGDFLCDHESSTCSARLSDSERTYSSICRNGEYVYVVGNKIYEIDENSKKETGHGGYGQNGVRILFGDYIAYFEKEDTIVVKEIESDKEIQRFEDIRGFTQGNFYYKEHLYYVTDELQLVRLDLNTGEKEVLEKKGATRASVYDGFIYYIKVSEETDTNYLIKMNPDTLEKQELIEGVFYYNMLGDTLYYSTWPERSLYCSDLSGENQKALSTEDGYIWSFPWAFPQEEILILDGDNEGVIFYLLDAASGEINFEEPIIRPE